MYRQAENFPVLNFERGVILGSATPRLTARGFNMTPRVVAVACGTFGDNPVYDVTARGTAGPVCESDRWLSVWVSSAPTGVGPAGSSPEATNLGPIKVNSKRSELTIFI